MQSRTNLKLERKKKQYWTKEIYIEGCVNSLDFNGTIVWLASSYNPINFEPHNVKCECGAVHNENTVENW